MISAIKGAADLLLPPACCICGGMAADREHLPKTVPGGISFCQKCLSELVPEEPDRRWLLCLSEPYRGDPYPGLRLYMAFPYNDLLQRAIPKIKFHHLPECALFLGRVLGNIARDDHIRADGVCPVPLSDKRMRERGYNQALLMARGFCEITKMPLLEDVLIRTRDTRRQTHIRDSHSRAGNVAGAFGVNRKWDIEGLELILLDDVVTTGSTLHEAASALLYAGASSVLTMALCGNRNQKNAESY